MNLLHWMRKENSGLARSTIELCEAEQRLGHTVCIRQPGDDMPLYGVDRDMDLHVIHSQLGTSAYFDNRPKIMFMHGEPLSSVGNGVSMKAICDLAPKCDAFIAMRKDELSVWQSIKRTYLIRKGIDLNRYTPLEGVTERLSGEPAVLYAENWRGSRNPLYLCVAMQEVYRRYPKARLHLYNCPDKKMEETFQALIKQAKWWPFVRTISGPVDGGQMNMLYNRVDIVVSCLSPLYARGIEAFGAGKAFIGPGYREPDYPYTCELEPSSMADAIARCWEAYTTFDFRAWAVDRHNVMDSAREAIAIYERYIDRPAERLRVG